MTADLSALAGVIAKAQREYMRLSRAVQRGDEPPAALVYDHEEYFIAAAVIAHLESDAVVRHAAAVQMQTAGSIVDRTRAALRAAGGGGGG